MKENMESDVKKVKDKYKKLRNRVLIVLLLVLIIFLSNLIYKAIIVQDILEENLVYKLGDNYKIIKTGFTEETKFVKDNMILQKNKNGGILTFEGKSYVLIYNTKEYEELDINLSILDSKDVTLMNYLTISEENIKLFPKMIWLVLSNNIKLKNETYNNTECITISVGDSTKLWFNKETKQVIKEAYSGQEFDIKIEKDTVTDEDVFLPWENGFTKREK